MNIFSTQDFSQFAHITQYWKIIKNEYDAVKHHAEKWPPRAFLKTPVDKPGGVKNNNGYWDFLPLYVNDKWLVDKDFCTVTYNLTKNIQGLWLAGFSILRAGCKIYPHRGPTSPEVFKYHLGLEVPEGTWIDIGGYRYFWKEGHDMIFDDAVEHFAENPTDRDRVILMIDVIKK